MFVDTFIRRPILASVCSLVIILAGAIAIPTLPIAQFPELAPPQVAVTAFYNGANAETVETAVTNPIEQAINGIEGMQYITSTSGNDGTSAVTVTFDITRSLDIAAVDVQNRLSQAEGRLPNEVKQVGISVQKVSTNFVLAAAAFTEKNEYDTLFISNYVDRFVRDEIKRVPGVGDVIVFGIGRYAMRLWLDPDRLAGRNLTADEVVAALREQNVQVAAGQVGSAPSRPGQTFQISVRSSGRLSEPSEFENIILKRSADGALVRVKDIGRVELGAESYSTAARYQGRDAVGFGVLQLPTANALQVYRDVSAEIQRLSARFPPGLKIEIAFDTTTVVAESIREVVTTLLEAIGLVVLVMFLFLQGWRTTLIPAITIPVSLVGTFAFVKLLGFSINTLTLFGITLATGLVVDDAIVVIENIERHIHEHHRPAQDAASEAMSEVTSAVIATALVLGAVFVPVAVFPGTTGRLYQQFALTIAISVIISAFNAMSLSPALAAKLLKPQKASHGPLRKFFDWFNRIFDKARNKYVAVAGVLIRKTVMSVIFLLLIGGSAIFLGSRLPTSFLPEEDQGYAFVNVQLPYAASLERTDAVCRKVEAILKDTPGVQYYTTVLGFSLQSQVQATYNAFFFVTLKPWNQRKKAAEQMM
ncbi:MAG TPA: efflux RND transporter permease subunit, partial [Vicinamibacterales bacterium]|nr:efflux RND transporter permease subunit [Vicinamibacterales bacterium]